MDSACRAVVKIRVWSSGSYAGLVAACNPRDSQAEVGSWGRGTQGGEGHKLTDCQALGSRRGLALINRVKTPSVSFWLPMHT